MCLFTRYRLSNGQVICNLENREFYLISIHFIHILNKKRRKDNRLILLYKGLKGKPEFLLMTLSQRTGVAEINTHWSFRFPLLVKMPTRKVSFPQTIRDWNVLPDSLISSAELSDDCVSKFTSLVRALGQSPGEVLSFWRFTSKLF